METPSTQVDFAFFRDVFAYAWHEDVLLVAAAVAIATAMLWRAQPDSHSTLRNTLYFLLFSYFGLALAGLANTSGHTQLATILHASFILAAGAAVLRLAGLFIFRVVLESMKIRPPSILEEILVVIAYFLWAMMQLHAAGVPLGEIVTTSAVATAILAFAMQDTLGNILGGLSLQWDHSLKVGDWIRLGEVEGKIVDVKWRAISVETRNWETVIIPNSMMMQNQFKVLGERLGESVKWRRWIWFNIDFGESPDQVIALAEQAIVAASIPGVATDPAPNCLLMDIDNSVGRYALRYWLTNLAKDDPTDSMVRQHIYAAINRQQIRLAMPRQHLYLTNKDEAYLEQKREDDLRRRTAAISQIDLFRPFTNEQLENLAGQLEYLPYAQSDIIFREGDDEHCLYVIADGTARVHVTDENGRLQHALSLGSGEFFGEMGLLTGAPRAATVTADTALECYRLGKNDFSKVLEEQDSIIEEMTRIMVSRQGVLQKAREEVHSGDGNTVQTHGHRELVSLIKHFFGTGKP